MSILSNNAVIVVSNAVKVVSLVVLGRSGRRRGAIVRVFELVVISLPSFINLVSLRQLLVCLLPLVQVELSGVSCVLVCFRKPMFDLLLRLIDFTARF